jgi:hypothetical protein
LEINLHICGYVGFINWDICYELKCKVECPYVIHWSFHWNLEKKLNNYDSGHTLWSCLCIFNKFLFNYTFRKLPRYWLRHSWFWFRKDFTCYRRNKERIVNDLDFNIVSNISCWNWKRLCKVDHDIYLLRCPVLQNKWILSVWRWWWITIALET